MPAIALSNTDPDGTLHLLTRLWREHMSRYRSSLAVVLLLTLVVAGVTALYPVVIDHAFQMFTARDERILYQIPILVMVVTAVKAIAQYFQSVMIQRVVLRIIQDLQNRLFGHLIRSDLARLERETPAQLSTRFTTDAAAIRELLTRAVNGIADLFTVIGLVASMFYLDWVLCLIAGILYPIAGIPIQKIGKRVRRASGGMQERTGETAALLTESFAQARTVIAYRLADPVSAQAGGSFRKLFDSLLRMSKSRARIDPILEVLGGTAVAAVIGFEGWRAAVGEHTLGNFTGFVAALLIASRPLRALGSLNAAVQEGLAGLVRVLRAIDEKPRIFDAADAIALPPGPGHVVFDDVRYVYPDGRVGVSGLRFALLPGQTVALVGASGGGKSTALSLVPRLHDVAAGAILIDGYDVRQLTLQSLRDAIAYVGQDALLFDDTVAANIAMGAQNASRERIEAAARAAAAAEFIAALPQGYDTVVGVGGRMLSGGQRQRIALARALVRDPRILLLDEATSALDTGSEAIVQEALRTLRKGRSTIIVAHRLSTIRDADLIVVIEAGRAVEMGTHEALMQADGAYAALVRGQARTDGVTSTGISAGIR